jgi:hypothetical protein
MAAHPHLTHVDDVAASSYEHGELRAARRRLGAAAGAHGVGLSRYDIPPGARTRVPADLVYHPRSAEVDVGGVRFRVEPAGHRDGEE